MMKNVKLIEELNTIAKEKSPAEMLAIVAERFPGKAVFTTSFGYEDQAISDMILSNDLPVSVVTLDTGRMFEETYKVWQRTLEKYQKPVIPYFPEPEDVESLLREKGPLSFYESLANRKECCFIRKVKPLNRALGGADCWITGLRASQSEGRSSLDYFMWDEAHNLIKFNPLLDWSLDQVIEYIHKNNVPYNALHDRGFVSIGCEPCTRAIKPGEDFRAGRWWWEQNSGKECGLHK
jgi:phosphoadenosine phosphosulfate reductase